MRFVIRLPTVRQLRADGMMQAALVSGGMHIGLAALLFLGIGSDKADPMPLPVHVVDLVDLPGGADTSPGGEPAPPAEPQAPPPPPEKQDAVVEDVPEPPKKKQKKRTPPKPKEPETKPEPTPVPARPAPPAAGGAADAPAEPAAEAGAGLPEAPAGAGLAAGAAELAGGIPTIDSDAFQFAYYRHIVTNRLRSTWSRPVVPGGLDQAIRATAHFVILRSGAVTDVELGIASGYSPLDRSALRAVFDANPMPPLPDGYEGDRLGVHFYFELTPER